MSDVLEELQELFAQTGVVLALTPGLNGTRVSGAARWSHRDQGLVQLSMRYHTDDHLWFTLYHEASHLLENTREDRLDSDPAGRPDADDDVERRVNERARDLLIDPVAFTAFVERERFDVPTVRAFAAEAGIAASVVVGRLQHDRYIDHSELNQLKRPVDWT